MSEIFKPKQFDSFEKVPEDQKKNFKKEEDGSFVYKEAAEELKDAEKAAGIANKSEKQGITSMDVLHKKAKEIENTTLAEKINAIYENEYKGTYDLKTENSLPDTIVHLTSNNFYEKITEELLSKEKPIEERLIELKEIEKSLREIGFNEEVIKIFLRHAMEKFSYEYWGLLEEQYKKL